ncbi:MAG: PilZ domain [Acidimicrobiales bacterium]|jgi:hypothetical protein|nr:PilZ domain [Acidimicrobiales bacterium]
MGLGIPGGEDRRAHPRIRTHLDAGFEVPGELQVFQCHVVDLSEDGARLRSEIALHPGQNGILVVAPPDTGVPVVAVVEVLRAQINIDEATQESGVRFHHLSPAARQRLADLLVGLEHGSAS